MPAIEFGRELVERMRAEVDMVIEVAPLLNANPMQRPENQWSKANIALIGGEGENVRARD
jgi:hypothetical protein